jgi:glutamate dehydrogenase (NADP+)
MATRDVLAGAFMEEVAAHAAGQDEFLQAVEEVATDVLPVEYANASFRKARVLQRLTVPDRMITFRVVWEDDAGELQINRGYRVQQSNALGPYKGGLRFHPTVGPSVLKFLAFEQTFKNALTGLPMGGGKGGADFDPRGRSEQEIRRFCEAFMLELWNHIGPDRDVPAGDINVGSREIGWLYGAYQRLAGRVHGALTGKGPSFGGSALRPEATGYGLLYFVEAMLARHDRTLDGLRVAISGKGNVATFAAEKTMALGGIVTTLSDTSGTLYAPDGFDEVLLDWARERKASGDDLSDPPSRATFHEGAVPWGLPCDVALPCATQNELHEEHAQQLIDNGCQVVAEGANMPCTAGAMERLRTSGLAYAPGKASNAGGVAVSGLEMSQNAQGLVWSADRVDRELRDIMRSVHDRCLADGERDGGVDYVRGANVAGYRKVATALAALGPMA